MENLQIYKKFMQVLISTGIETQTAMVLTVAMKNKQDRMDKAVNFIEKNQNLTPDQIARQVMKIAMSKTIEEDVN